ncbi:aldo/keto reductase [Streptococcus jiangjianxini]|uniref:aldo/keto reductase n=1 Tax=Streptococcus jiangjianxini TaxID=3161189 RepID=UPI0032EDB4A4
MSLLDYGRLGMGTWNLGDNPESRQEELSALRYGLDKGLKIIDTAEMYGNGRSENLVGEAIWPYNREDLYLISKVLPSHANKTDLETSLDNSLRELKTDYLDLYLYHWRGGTPLEETVDELERMVDKGKIKAWGVSNFDVEDMEDLMATKFGKHCQANEVLYHLGSRGIEVNLKPYQDELRIPTIAYCPLAQAGDLKRQLFSHKAVQQVSEDLGITVYQVLLCFTLAQSNMVSIPRTGQVKHMMELVDCLSISLDKDHLGLLNQAFPAPKKRVPLDVQ